MKVAGRNLVIAAATTRPTVLKHTEASTTRPISRRALSLGCTRRFSASKSNRIPGATNTKKLATVVQLFGSTRA
jgi:hypothetical protein